MASETQPAGNGASDGSNLGDEAWVNPNNITASDGTSATCSHGLSAIETEYLVSSNSDFSAIPSGATIDGFAPVVRCKCDNSRYTFFTLKLVKAGSLVGNNLAAGEALGTSYGDISFGGPTELGGTSWSDTDVKHAGFGIALSLDKTSGGSDIAYVDYIEIEVFFTSLPDAVGSMGNPSSAWLFFTRK